MNIIKSIAIIVGGIIIADIVRDILDSLVEESVTDDYITISEEDSAAVLEKLADDEDEGVRYRVAGNHNTPVYLLEKLADDEDEDVRSAVIRQAKGLTDTDFAMYVTAIAKSYD